MGRGIDLVAPMQVGWYNRGEPPETRLPEPAGPNSLALVLANTRALWDPFRSSLRGHPLRMARINPLDRYVEASVEAALEGISPAPLIFYGHGRKGRTFSLQRAAAATSMVSMSPCHLVIHQEVGLWLGLRGVLIFDLPGPERPLSQTPSPCESCQEKPCLPGLERALGKKSGSKEQAAPPRSIRQRWEPWLAMRDACPVGRAFRYSDAQICYHYALDRLALAVNFSASCS